MKQLLARVDDDLHAWLRAESSRTGRSMNSIINELIRRAATAAAGLTERDRLRVRAEARGLVADVGPPPASAPSRAEVLERVRGFGPFLDELLAEQRAE